MLRKNLDLSSTIFALTTGSLPSAVAVIRLSGPDAFPIAKRLFTLRSGDRLSKDRAMHLGTLRDLDGKPIDEILLLSFVSPHSFTGEDCIEFHCHGASAIVGRLEAVLLELGARSADRGEFSYRAHLAGKLSANDLDVMGDLFLARDAEDLNAIFTRNEESIGAAVSVLRAHLVQIQAILDTAVDFSEEYASAVKGAEEPIQKAILGCQEIIHRYSCLREGSQAPRLVLAGLPNAGKSSLFNAILCRYRAIVDSRPGTTRDVIEEDIVLGAKRWKLVDTAGVRESSDSRERQGLDLGSSYLRAASFWILVVDSSAGISPADMALLETRRSIPHLVAWNKTDKSKAPPPNLGGARVIPLSALTGAGIAELSLLVQETARSALSESTGPLPTSIQAARLGRVLSTLEGLLGCLRGGVVPPEVLAEESRAAIADLELVIGEVHTEEILERVFREFCVGK